MNFNSRVQHPVPRVSTKFNVYYHRTQLNSLSLSLFQFHNMFRPMQKPSSGVVS
jgi:hypothetical protein